MYCLGKGQERSFPLTSTYLGRKPVQTKYPTAAFLNGYPPSSELLGWLKGKGETVQGIFHSFTGPVSKERIVALSCLNESTFVDGCSFGSLLSIFRTTGSTTPAFSLWIWNPKVKSLARSNSYVLIQTGAPEECYPDKRGGSLHKQAVFKRLEEERGSERTTDRESHLLG